MEALEFPHVNQKAVWEKHFELWTLPDLKMVFLKCSFWFSFIYTEVQALGRFIIKAPFLNKSLKERSLLRSLNTWALASSCGWSLPPLWASQREAESNPAYLVPVGVYLRGLIGRPLRPCERGLATVGFGCQFSFQSFGTLPECWLCSFYFKAVVSLVWMHVYPTHCQGPKTVTTVCRSMPTISNGVGQTGGNFTVELRSAGTRGQFGE